MKETLKKPRPLHTQIFLGMAVGLVLGLVARFLVDAVLLKEIVVNIANPLGQIFLRTIFMVVVPLIVSALVLGVTEIGDVGRVGRIGLKTLLFTLLFSGIAVMIGITATNAFQPGVGLSQESREALKQTMQGEDAQEKVAQAGQAKTPVQTFLSLIPKNPLQEATNAFEGGLIPLMVFALIFGVALSMVDKDTGAPLKALFQALFAVSLKVISFAMKLAPLGVGALMFSVCATLGADAIWLLGKYALLVLAALCIQQFLVYGLAIRLLARRDPVAYFKDLREVMLTAISTSSSNATLPLALQTAQEKLKLPEDSSRFVLTIGATANQNGTALYEGITVLFLAQFFGVELSLGQQLGVVLMSILAGVGTAGVPGGSLPLIVVVLQSIGVPGEGIGIILGIDRILDMSRTVLNVSGDLTIATCVAASEKAPSSPPDARAADVPTL